jgi:hypothetical protein
MNGINFIWKPLKNQFKIHLTYTMGINPEDAHISTIPCNKPIDVIEYI